MEEAEIDEDYVEMASVSSAITTIAEEKKSSQLYPASSDQHSNTIPPDDVKMEEEKSIYQLPKANPVPLTDSHIDHPLVPPKIASVAKNRKSLSSGPEETERLDQFRGTPLDPLIPPRNILRPSSNNYQPLLHHPQSPTSPPASSHHNDQVTVQSPVTQSNESRKGDDSFDADDTKSLTQTSSAYQPLKINRPLSPSLYDKRTTDILLPPRNITRPKTDQPQSPTSPGKPRRVSTTTPVSETIQVSTGDDIPRQSAQNNKVNDLYDKKSSGRTEQQDSTYQGLLITDPTNSPKVDNKQLDPLVPPRNILRSNPNNPSLHSPLSPVKDKTNDADDSKSSDRPEQQDSAYQGDLTASPKVNKQLDPLVVPPRNILRSNPNNPALPVCPLSPMKDKTNDSFNADKKSSGRAEQQDSTHQGLKTDPTTSPKVDNKQLDPLVPPRNILRSNPNKPSLHSPLSPVKDKVPDKIISVKEEKTNTLLTPPRNLNPYILDTSRNVRNISLKEKEQPKKQQQQGSTIAQDVKNPLLQEVEEYVNELSYTLEEFVEIYQLPQLVSVTEGHYGDTDDFSMSEGMELILFFKKQTQAVTATARHTDKTYYIPMNCSLQFSPYQRNSREHLAKSYYYQTVNQLLQRKEGLPKVVKVLKGRKAAPILNANELLFPKGLSHQGTHVKFTDIKKEEVKLRLSCDIGFSTNPSDIKMHLADYVENINEFPSSVMVFCDPRSSETMFEIHTGMEMVLQECKMLYSCICSTDVHGQRDYELMELLTALPIEVKAIRSPTVGLDPIYDTAKKVYETFNLSMIQTSMFLAQDDEHCYAEIRNDNQYVTRPRGASFYNIEKPAVAFGMIRREKPDRSSPTVASPPLPPRYTTAASCKLQPQSKIFQHSKQLQQDPVKDADYVYTSTADQRRFYLKTFTPSHVLQLLDKMNLGHFKGMFQKNGIDGKGLLLLTMRDLEEMGIKDSKSQRQLMDVISGHKAYKVK